MAALPPRREGEGPAPRMRLSPALRLGCRRSGERGAALPAGAMRPPSRPLARAPLLLTLLVLPWLGGTRAQGTCAPPERLTYAELEEPFNTMKSFPDGTTVSYICRPGYARIPGKPSSRTCGKDSQWSPLEQFCTERKCSHPGELQHGSIHVTDLRFGSKVRFSCEEGFRLVGTAEITCVIVGEGVGWNRDLPFCEKIPCEPPPQIANGRHTEADEYVYQTSVTYTCDDVPRGSDPFSLIGSATLVCTFDEKTLNGIWSESPPECKVVKCPNPRVENGFKRSGLGPSYSYKDSVVFECNAGYSMVGSSIITCTENNIWHPSAPTCTKIESTCDAPKITHAVVTPEKPVYATGESVQIRCTAPCTFPDGAEEMTATCQGQSTWSPLQDCACEPEGSGSTPHIPNGRVVDGEKPSYNVGDFITIECYAGYTLHGAARIQYIGENQWTPGVPTCHLSEPEGSGSTPDIHNGRVVDGKKPSYNVGDFITIECYAGYTLHGSARIQYTGENQWTPGVPTCHLSAYITAIICVIVAIVVILAAFWIYKKYFSQNGSYTVDESCKETCILKSNVPAEMEETAQKN